MHDLIIIGGGPAGLTAAVYARRAGKSVLVIEKNTFGGQITWSPRVENFPGFVSVSGAQFEAKAVILAVGAKPRPLGVKREEEFVGSGVNYCAVCDGAFYAGLPVAVVGGGNSALQDAMLLSETCSKVYLIHRRDSFRGEQALADALQQKANVEFVLNASVAELLGGDALTGIVVEQNGERRTLAVEGVFVAVGHMPQNGAFENLVALDARGYADSGEDCVTAAPGVFVAGDCRRKNVRQLTTAVADGAVAALAAVHYIDSKL